MDQGTFWLPVLDRRIICGNYLDECKDDKSDRAQSSALIRKSVYSVSRSVVLRKDLFSDISCY